MLSRFLHREGLELHRCYLVRPQVWVPLVRGHCSQCSGGSGLRTRLRRYHFELHAILYGLSFKAVFVWKICFSSVYVLPQIKCPAGTPERTFYKTA